MKVIRTRLDNSYKDISVNSRHCYVEIIKELEEHCKEYAK